MSLGLLVSHISTKLYLGQLLTVVVCGALLRPLIKQLAKLRVIPSPETRPNLSLKAGASSLKKQTAQWSLWPTLLGFALLSFAIPSLLLAQGVLDMEDAVIRALNRNPVFQAKLQALGVSQAAVNGAGIPTIQNPQIQLGTGRRSSPEGNSLDWSLGLSHQLELGGKRSSRIQVAQSQFQEAEAQLRLLALQLAYEVRQSFVQVQVAHLRAQNMNQLLKLSEKFVEVAGLRYEAGETTQLELNLALAERGKARAESLLAQRDVVTAQLALTQQLGAQKDELPEVSSDVVLPLELPEAAELLPKALSMRPEFLVTQRAALVAIAEEALANSQNTSDLSLNLGWAQEGNEDVLAAGVGLSIPLWNRQQGAIGTARATKRKAQFEEKAWEFQISRELTLASARYLAIRQVVELYEKEVLTSFEENAQLLNESFKNGRVDFLRTASVQRELAQQQQRHLEILEEALLALVEWQRVSGQALPADWSIPNPVLSEK